MDTKQLAAWWKDAQEAAAPAHGAAAVVAYVREHGTAGLDELRELLTDEGVAAAEQMPLLASLVDQGALAEQDDADGLTYTAPEEAGPDAAESYAALHYAEVLDTPLTYAEFTEGDHPRATDGTFGKGSGKKKKPAAKARTAPPGPASGLPLPQRATQLPLTTTDPLHGHPLAGRSRDEQHAQLAEQIDAEQRSRRVPREAAEFAGYTPPQGPAVAGQVLAALEALDTDKYQPPSLEAVYAAVRPQQPTLTIAQFQGVVARLRHEERLRLEPHTRAISELERPEHVLPLSGELMSHVQRMR